MFQSYVNFPVCLSDARISKMMRFRACSVCYALKFLCHDCRLDNRRIKFSFCLRLTATTTVFSIIAICLFYLLTYLFIY